jgi:hypothetical protein
VSDLLRALVDDLAADEVALQRLRALIGGHDEKPDRSLAPAHTVRSLARELGRSERSVRGAITRAELEAVKRGKGWVIAVDAVARWATAPPRPACVSRKTRRRGSGAMARGLNDGG